MFGIVVLTKLLDLAREGWFFGGSSLEQPAKLERCQNGSRSGLHFVNLVDEAGKPTNCMNLHEQGALFKTRLVSRLRRLANEPRAPTSPIQRAGLAGMTVAKALGWTGGAFTPSLPNAGIKTVDQASLAVHAREVVPWGKIGPECNRLSTRPNSPMRRPLPIRPSACR